jgi:putative hemolysin
VLAVLLALALAAGPPAQTAADGELDAIAAFYCAQVGGTVTTRYPAYGTNDADPLRLAGARRYCEFEAADSSRIAVALETLSAEEPSLAVAAYRDPPPLKPGPPSANPSSVYCSQLGGTDQFGGVNAAGGGWVREGSPEMAGVPQDVISMCVFPDLSSIDSWGLTYHSNGVVRGADLTPLFRYQPGPATAAGPRLSGG